MGGADSRFWSGGPTLNSASSALRSQTFTFLHHNRFFPHTFCWELHRFGNSIIVDGTKREGLLFHPLQWTHKHTRQNCFVIQSIQVTQADLRFHHRHRTNVAVFCDPQLKCSAICASLFASPKWKSLSLTHSWCPQESQETHTLTESP